MSPKATLLFVPGYWEGGAPFHALQLRLAPLGYLTHIAPRPSTDFPAEANPSPSMSADVTAIRACLTDLVEISGKEVLLVLHSAGGFLGAEAMKGLDVKARESQGLKGGVRGIIFVAAGVVTEGHEHGRVPFAEVDEDGHLHCRAPRTTLFNQLSDFEAFKWESKLRPQPKGSWTGTTTYCGWRDVPSVYVVCENDQCVPLDWQVKMAELAGSQEVRMWAAHMPMLSHEGEFVVVLEWAIGKLMNGEPFFGH